MIERHIGDVLTRNGDWIQTYTGVCFYPLDPRPEDVRIEDIAHSLSMQCRFNGHCKWFYSVAEHSCNVSRMVPPEHALQGLMHDAAEAYLCDIPKPIKNDIPSYKIYEAKVEMAIAQKFDLRYPWNQEVKKADNRMLMEEAHAMMIDPSWADKVENPVVDFTFMNPKDAKEWFLERFNELN